MLKYLQIDNIAVIEKSDIELSEGFTVLTGETGAGKSIVIDALSAVLGERTSKELIRSGCKSAEVSALFSALSSNAIKILNEQGYQTDENGELLVKRVISENGGMVKINGKAATVGVLKSIGNELVDIHGQHDNKNLLDEQRHLEYIDRLAQNDKIFEEYNLEFNNIKALHKSLRALQMDQDEKQRKTDLLTFQITELENANIKLGESEELKKRLNAAINHENIIKALNLAVNSINGADEQEGAVGLLDGAKRELLRIGDDFSQSAEKLQEIIFDLDFVSNALQKYMLDNDYNENSVNEIRERLDFLYHLMLKYGDSEEKLLEFLSNAKKELETITFSEQKTEEISLEIDEATERLVALGERLTKSRTEAAKAFQTEVKEGLEQLNMLNVRFIVDFSKGRYTKTGCDEVRFLISANEGEEPRALAKIASGGELSRIMLVIKRALAEKDSVSTLVFDEIDTGISGNAAVKVGQMLRNVSKSAQDI